MSLHLHEDSPTFLVAEIGINHNGSIDIAKNLMALAKGAGFDCVKFQKRTIDIVYTQDELAAPRETPFGKTNGDLKRALEFGRKDYDHIDKYAKELGIFWTASPWDEESVDFLLNYDLPYIKVASASVTDIGLLAYISKSGVPIWISTGMCDLDMIMKAITVIRERGGYLGCVYHCTSTYPSDLEELNLSAIPVLKQKIDNSHNLPYCSDRIPKAFVGYSGHEKGVTPSVIAVVLGARSVERHITIDRTMFGSDQSASLEPRGFTLLARDIRDLDRYMGDSRIKIYESEKPIAKKLRRKNTL
jgi:N-acetylneuraminate synthase